VTHIQRELANMSWRDRMLMKLMSNRVAIKIMSIPIVMKIMTIEMKALMWVKAVFSRQKLTKPTEPR
jgi:hypothetical protein